MIPRSVTDKVGIVRRYRAEVELADGRVIERDVPEAVAELNNVTNTIPLLISSDDEEPRLGLTALGVFRRRRTL